MSGYTKHQVNKALRALRDRVNKGRLPFYGICRELDAALIGENLRKRGKWDGAFAAVMELATGWPKFSGIAGYPVPSPDKRMSAPRAYDRSLGCRWTGEYGKLRLELLDYLIKETDA